MNYRHPRVHIVDKRPLPIAVESPCRSCAEGISYRGPEERAVIEAWNDAAETPHLRCDKCRGAEEGGKAEILEGQRREAREAAERYQRAKLEAVCADLPGALAGCGVPPHWCEASLDLCPDLPAGYVKRARAWAAEPKGILYLYGPPGAGKSYLAVGILRAILNAGKLSPSECLYVGEREYLQGLRASYGEEARSPSWPEEHAPRHYDVPLVLLDDLAATRLTGWGKDEVAGLIEHRHGEELPTIVTSNLDPNGLSNAVDARVASRIAEHQLMLELPARDLRITGTVRREEARG